MIRIQGWRYPGVCNTSSDELLRMVNDSYNQTKVLRYSGSTEKQSINSTKNRTSFFYSPEVIIFQHASVRKKNFDICFADNNANAVVVVNQSNKFRFRYTFRGLLHPVGIATDSQIRILILYQGSNFILSTDQDGLFLRYINNCYLRCPCSLYKGRNYHHFVAESATGEVNIIQY